MNISGRRFSKIKNKINQTKKTLNEVVTENEEKKEVLEKEAKEENII